MAGDWIKIEHVTIDKPEIFAVAEELEISVEEAFGHVFRIWVWCDQQSVNGNALSVTKNALDRIAQRYGTATAMENAGWLTTKNDKLYIPNFERHNGETAKKRALTKKRVDKHRNASSVTDALPEKRREEYKKNKQKKIEYTPEFERFWADYPKRAGANGKGTAFKSWTARINEGATPEDMHQGALRYAAYCESVNSTNTQYVMQCSKFLGTDKHYENTWNPPVDKDAIQPPNYALGI